MSERWAIRSEGMRKNLGEPGLLGRSADPLVAGTTPIATDAMVAIVAASCYRFGGLRPKTIMLGSFISRARRPSMVLNCCFCVSRPVRARGGLPALIE
jgi:hypothetical protein